MELNNTTIQDIAKFSLCEYRDGTRLSVNVWAEIRKECLLISGQDLGDVVQEHFSDSDYEYWYAFDVENTKLLFTKLSEQNPELNIQELVTENFSGLDGCRNLRDYCKQFDIQYDFSSHI